MGRGRSGCFQCAAAGTISLGLRGAGICRLLLRCSCAAAGGAVLPYRRGVGAGEAVSFAQRRMEGDVPAVSNARRLVDRLQGGQHCRSALEIRSEVSAPALMVPRYLGTIRKVSSLLFSGSGGLGLRLEALRIFRAFHLRPPSLATAGSARTRQGTLGSLDSPSAAASSDEEHYAFQRRRKPLPQRRSAVVSNFVSTKNVPQRAAPSVPCGCAAAPPWRRSPRLN